MSNLGSAAGESPPGIASAPSSATHDRRSLSSRLLLVISMAFLVVVGLGARFTWRFGRLAAEGLGLTLDLKETLSLNSELRHGVADEIAALRRQLEAEDPAFPAAYRRQHYELTEKEMRYLKLQVGEPERLRVEQLRALHAELGLRAGHLVADLEAGRRDHALGRLRMIEQLGDDIGRTFDVLEGLQLRRLSAAALRLEEVVASGERAILTVAAALVALLALLAFYVRRTVLRPLERLQRVSDALRRGDFSVRAPVVRDDEIGRLAKGFNFMAASLSESWASLEQKVEERTRALSALQEQLVHSAKMSAIGQLVSGVAHELNNPLTAILGFSELLRNELATAGADPQQVKRVEEIVAEADRCRRIVANLLQFARRSEPRLVPVGLNDVVEQMLRLREYDLDTRNVRLVRSYDESEPAILADAGKLQQVVLNLVGNARDALVESGREGRIEVATRVEGDRVVLSVSDDGTGMKEPSRVFEPFYTTKEVGKGTGLGLSVCYGIVHEHGGTITGENRPEGGARFVVTLPRAAAAADEKAAPAAEPPVSRLPRRALVVDDEKPLLSLQISYLGSLGVSAEGVASGEEAVRYLESNSVDLVVSDVRMPGRIDGVALYDWVGAHRPELKSRFLLVSGDIVGVDERDLMRHRGVPCLQKPFRFGEYSRAVRQVLGG